MLRAADAGKDLDSYAVAETGHWFLGTLAHEGVAAMASKGSSLQEP